MSQTNTAGHTPIARGLKRKILTMFLSLLMVLTMMPTLPGAAVHAAAGDVPAHSKTLTSNNDGTYQLALNIKGENEKIVNKVNVIVILDVSSSMNTNAGGGTTRLSAAKSAINNLANTLLSMNGQGENPTDAVEMALVTFGNTATTRQNPTTSATTFTSSVSGITIPANVGTNWEAAMQQGNTVNFNDNDQTFVIFVSDGNPTFRYTEGNYPNHNNDFNQFYYNQYGVWGSGSENDSTTVSRCYDHAVDDATTLAQKYGVNNFYTIGAYGSVDRMQSLTTATGAPANHYFSATNTTQLQQALASILEDIQTAGIGSATINDPTTTNVVVSTDVTAHLLTVDDNSFKYYRNGVEWTDAPEAELDANGNVQWDLSSVGILDNDVTYTVTFDVWPTQETYDMIADLENGDLDYETGVPAAVKEYLIENADGTYTLKTNKNYPTITYTDTRTDDGPQTINYTNPAPVPTEVSEMDVSKVWFNDLDDRGAQEYPNGFTMDLTRDGIVCDSVTVKPQSWADNVYISTGLMRVHKNADGEITGIEVLEDGHDYTLVEPPDMEHRWELVVETIHPMLINGVLVSLVEVLPEDIPEGMGSADFYTLAGVNFYRLKNGNVYKENGQGSHAAVSAYNERKSNLNLTKVVDGDDAPEDELFEYTITVTDPKGADLWFSVVTDPDNPDDTLVKDLETTATPEEGDTGYFYFSSGNTITVKMQAGWNLRFTNLPTGTTYNIVETTTGMSTGFTFDNANGDTTITVSELPDGAVDMGDGTYSYDGIIYTGSEAEGYTYTYQPTISGATVNGKVVAPNGSYQVTYTNLYSLKDVEITKVWEDNDDQDGIRPTAEEFKSYLKLYADGTDVTTANADKLAVTENEDGTFTAKWTAVQRFKENTTTKEEITYTVEETEIPGYTTTGSPAADGGTITNTHVPEEVDVTIVKDWSDSDDIGEIRPASIQVQLSADGTAKGDPVTLNEEGDWSYTWEGLPKYSNGTEITYTADETVVPAGYTKVGPEKTVAEDGTITITVTNRYTPTPVSVDPPVQKIIENNDDLYNKGDFTFTIEATSPTDAPMPELTSITNSADYEVDGKTGFYEFGEIVFTTPGTYTYTVKESGDVDGVTNDTSAETGKTITFEVTDDGTGKLVVSPTTDQVQLSFTNVYDAEGETEITVSKAITGAAWPAGKTLTLTIQGAAGAPMPETTTATLSAAGDVTFGPIAYGLSDAGKTYTYTITESSFGAGWSGSPASITATVAVTDNGDGTLATEVTYDPANATFTNTYEAEGEAEITVTKELSGAAWPTGKTLTFTLAGAEGAPMPETATATLSAAGDVTFGPIAYDESAAGQTYTYTITESSFGAGWSGSPASITATVEVTDNGDGTLDTAVTYSPEDATFTNTYEASGNATLSASKALVGRAWQDGESYTFTLSAVTAGAPMPAAGGETATYTADGSQDFGTITYSQADAGKTFEYKISETSELPAGITKSGDITATVTVTDNGDGTLATSVTYDPTNATIINTYEATGSVEIKVNKELIGRDWIENEQYTFTLKDAEGNALEEKTVDKDNLEATFTAIPYTEADAGKTFTYTVEETSTLPGGITNSGAITVNVEVTDNGNGTLSTAATYTDAQSAENDTITNKYDSEGSVELEAIKELEGREWQTGETYTFTLKDSEGNVIDEQTVSSDTTVTFDKIEYTEEDMVDENGNYVTTITYEYTIEETTTMPDGMTNSGSITATVTLTDDGEGNITAEVEYTNDDTIVNTYGSEGEVELKASKALVGRAWQEGEEYTFTLSAADGTPMPAAGGETATYTADGEQAFGKITYTQKDMLAEDGKTYLTEKTYTYTISETSTLPSGVVKSNDITATVVLTDDGSGKIATAVTYDPTSDTITNTYTSTGEVTLGAAKHLANRAWHEGEEYTFTLSAAEGTPMPAAGGETVTFTSDSQKNFGVISFTQDDMKNADGAYVTEKTLTYTISETSTLPNGVANTTGDITATVVLTDDGEGHITAEVTYDPTSDTITNTYTAEGEATLEVTKELTGRVWKEGETFTFTLIDGDGNDIESKTVTEAAPTATFTALKYYINDEVDDTKTDHFYTIKETSELPGGVTNVTGDITAKVVVTDDGDGKLSTAVSYADSDKKALDPSKVVNDYKADPVKATIGVNKTVAGYIAGKDKYGNTADTEFTFTLAPVTEGAPMPASGGEKVSFTTENGEGSGSFGEITYTFEDMNVDGEQLTERIFEYQVTETKGDAKGYTYDTTSYQVKVTVTDDQNGKLETAIVSQEEENKTSVDVENQYKEEAAEVTLHLTKNIEDLSDSAPDATFTFQLLDENDNIVQTKEVTTEELIGEVDFDPLVFTKAGTYKYKLVEIIPKKNEQKAEETTTDAGLVSTEAAGAGLDEAADEPDLEAPAVGNDEFAENDAPEEKIEGVEESENEAESEGEEAEGKAAKAEGEDAEGEGTEGEGTEGEDAEGEDAEGEGTEGKGAEGEGTEGEGTEGEGTEGEGTEGEGTEGEGTEGEGTEGEGTEGEGTEGEGTEGEDAEVTEGEAEEGEIANEPTEEPTATGEEVEEEYDPWTYETHVYEIVIIISDNFKEAQLERTVLIDGEETLNISVTNVYKAKETTSVIEVNKTIEDTSDSAYDTVFEFTLSAVTEGAPMPAKGGEKATVTGEGTAKFGEITFTKAGTFEYTIQETAGDAAGYIYDTTTYNVTVKVEDVGGKLEATVTYGSDKTELTITNTYDPKDAEVIFGARKMIKDASKSAPDEDFTFQLLDKDHKVIQEVSRLNGGPITFKAITFSKVGTYNYYIKEVAGTTRGYAYDTREYPVTVTVSDPGDGQLTADVDYGAEELVIENPYAADPTEVVFRVKKSLLGMNEGVEPETFSFILSDASGKELETVTVNGDGSASFSAIKYTEVGTYEYIITEKNEGKPGYSYDSSSFNVTVKVTDVDCSLQAETTISRVTTDVNEEVKAIVFVNSYSTKPVDVELKASKKLTGRDLKKGEFSFLVYMDGKVVLTGTNEADGTIDFGSITFDKVGTYELTVMEQAVKTMQNMTFDDTVYTVTVTVTDNGKGELEAAVEGGENIVFTNKYNKPPEPPEPPEPPIPHTGDENNMMLWYLLLALGAGGLATAAIVRKRSGNKE